VTSDRIRETSVKVAAVAWLVTAVYYFYQYALRSAPGVMIPQLSDAFGLTAMGVGSLVGLFYFGYSPFSLVAGVALDRFGARSVVPIGAALVGVGALLFGLGDPRAASVGRFVQGAGGVFALVGAIYIVGKSFPPSSAATLIGATQMFGMAGGSAGQFVVGPLIAAGMAWNQFWIGMGISGIALSVLLFALIPSAGSGGARSGWLRDAVSALGAVFRNPQSLLCGAVAGLLFIPTTIFDMIWGVRYLQDAHGYEYGEAVIRSATVPLGWIVGAPLMGWISDRIGRRKPVIVGSALALFACLFWILYGPTDLLPPYVLGIATGVASGAAMLPYTVIKEANPPSLSGTATGVINFLNFTFSALLAPMFASALRTASDGAAPLAREHFQAAFQPLLWGVGLAIILTIVLRETGPGARPPLPIGAAAKS
jgi:MFS family permease